MPPVRVTRFQQPVNGWLGTVEPKSRRWILFVYENEMSVLFDRRDPSTGAVKPPEPEKR
jgi:hypothetical protein